MAGTKIIDLHLNKLISCRKEELLVCKSLTGWKNTAAVGSNEANIKTEVDALTFSLRSDFRPAKIKAEKDALAEVIKARMHVKCSGK